MVFRIVFKKKAICIFFKQKLLFCQPFLVSKLDKSLFLYFYAIFILYRFGLLGKNK